MDQHDPTADDPTDGATAAAASGPNELTPLRFIIAFSVVSMLADFVHQGSRAIMGPFLASFGAAAGTVGFVTALGETVAFALRLGTGRIADRTQHYWLLVFAGYGLQVLSAPVLALAWSFWPATMLVVIERFGKAIRSPARDTMLSQASTDIGRGTGFALHEALGHAGALFGPLLVAGMIVLSGYRAAFAVLIVPGALALAMVAWLRRAVPKPQAYEEPGAAKDRRSLVERLRDLPRRYWTYTGFTALTMAGFTTFPVLAYHQQAQQVFPDALIPVTYTVGMAAAAVISLAAGWLYDRIGLASLVPMVVLSAAVPFLAFSNSPALVWIGTAAWGAGVGLHESTMRAVIADLVPMTFRATALGLFTGTYGLAMLAGSTIIGVLYAHSWWSMCGYVVAAQLAALVLLIRLVRRKPGAPEAAPDETPRQPIEGA